MTDLYMNCKLIKKRALFAFIAVVAVSCGRNDRAGAKVIDEIGRTITMPAAVNRIITLTPALTEIVFALGQDSKLVGVTDFCNYPPATRNKQRVGTYSTPNVEMIVSLKPDLVLASKDGNSKALVDKLTQMGIAVYTVSPQNIEQIMATIGRVGTLVGAEVEAKALVSDMQNRFMAIMKRVQGKPVPSVLCVIGEKPLFVVGPGSFPDDVITRAGGRICTADAKMKYPQYSMEDILIKNPDIIIKTTMLAANADVDAFAGWRQWEKMNAVKNNRLYMMNSDILLRPGPRIIDGVEMMAEILHGTANSKHEARNSNQ